MPYLTDLKMYTFLYASMSDIRTNVITLTGDNSQLSVSFWGLPALGGNCLTQVYTPYSVPTLHWVSKTWLPCLHAVQLWRAISCRALCGGHAPVSIPLQLSSSIPVVLILWFVYRCCSGELALTFLHSNLLGGFSWKPGLRWHIAIWLRILYFFFLHVPYKDVTYY